MDDYGKIMVKMDNIIENLYEIGELAESTGFFPVIQFVNLQHDFEVFYRALRGASEKAAEFNYKMAKENLSSIYADTDSCRVNSYDECFRKKVSERVTGENCKKCPFAWKCFKIQNN